MQAAGKENKDGTEALILRLEMKYIIQLWGSAVINILIMTF